MKRFSLLVALLLAALALAACDRPAEPRPTVVAALKEIKVGYDPNKAALFEELLGAYNRSASTKVRGVKLEIPLMLEELTKGELIGLSPDSSIWLESFDEAWRAANPQSQSIIGTTVRYATTPVVIATWQGREGELGADGERGWASLLRRASQDANYRWSHGSPRASASGMLALVAEFYAGANKTAGLTKADADREEVRSYVSQIEKSISRYGGESDAALVEYLLKEGSSALSATVMPEASAFDFNRRSQNNKLYAAHPAEGTLMLDHPLILLETPSLTPEQRRAFLDFGRFLTGPDGQGIVVKHGYRPVDLGFDMAASPLKTQGLATAQPRLLQLPVPGTTAYLRSAWASGLKRRANILLVVDVSGSMSGDKLTRTKEALTSFLKQVPSDEERVGLATFSTDYLEIAPLGRLADNRGELLRQIERLRAEGSTSLYYAIWRAHRTLVQLGDKERINVVVAMTDGMENTSNNFNGRSVRGVGLVPQITSANTRDVGFLQRALSQNGSGVLIFDVGYGSDPDMDILRSIAGASGGQAYRADPDTIRKLYELISQNF